MNLSHKAKKAVAAGLALSTVMWSVSMFALPAAFAAPHSEGCLVNSGGTVYLVTGGQRRGFTSAEVFASHGYNFGQVVASNSEDDAIPVGPIMVYADGSIVKGPNDPLVYLVANGQKRGFVSGSVFTGLGYSFANIQWAPVNTFSDLPTGSNVESATERHPAGTWVLDGSGTVWKMTNTGRMGLPSMAVFNSYGKSWATVVSANAADLAASNEGVATERATCAGGSTPPPVSGSISAALASDNPVSSTLVATQAQADLAHFALSGSGTVTSLTVERIGVSANTTLSNIYLFQGATRLTDSATMGSDNKVTFAGLNLSVPTTVAVKSDILTGTQGQTVGVKLAAINGSAVSVSGNIHTIATATLASVALSSPTGGGNTDPGNDINVWQGTVAVGQRDVVLNRLALRQVGSIQSSDIRNFRLQVDGVQVASVSALDSNGYVTFAPNVTVKSGTRTFKVMADIIGGSGRTYGMSLRGAYDVVATDSQYNVGIVATLSAAPFGPSAANVNAGNLTVTKASDSASSNLVAGANDASVGKWTFTAFGETMKVETLTVGINTNGTDANNSIRDVGIYVDGTQVGSSSSVSAVDAFATGEDFTTNFYVYPGTSRTVEIRADMVDDDGGSDLIAAGTTTSIQFSLLADTNNVVPQVSLTPTGAPLGSASNANALTISTGSISLASTTTYPNQTTTAPQSSYKLGSWTLSGNATESVNINTLGLGFVGGDTFDASSDLSNVYFKINGTPTTIKSTVVDGAINTLSNTYSVNFSVPVNGTATIELWATIGSSITAAGSDDTMIAYIRAIGTTSVSGTTVYADVNSDSDSADGGDNGATGQTILIGSGSITATLDASSTSAQLVDDSGTVTSAAFKFAAVTDSYTVTDLTMTIGSCTAVSLVTVKDGASTVASGVCATTKTFSGLNVAVAANTNKVLTVELTMSSIGPSAGTSDSSLITTVTAFTARDSNGSSGAGTVGSATGNSIYAYRAVPLVSAVALSNAVITAGTGRVIAKFSVSSNGTGTVDWKQIMLEISKTATPTIASVALYNAETGQQITAAFVFNNETVNATSTVLGADGTAGELLISVGTNANDDVSESVSGTKTYEVRATIGGAVDPDADNIAVTMDRNISTHSGKGLYAAIANQGGGAANANDTAFTWSDGSDSAGGNDTGVAQWNDDYLVKNLPLSWNLN